MSHFSEVVGHRVVEVREKRLPPKGDYLFDGRGFVILEGGNVFELIEHNPWAVDDISFELLKEGEGDWSTDSFVSRHSPICQGRTVVDICRTESVPYLVLLLDDNTILYMDCENGGTDTGIEVFHEKLGKYIDDLRSWTTDKRYLYSPRDPE